MLPARARAQTKSSQVRHIRFVQWRAFGRPSFGHGAVITGRQFDCTWCWSNESKYCRLFRCRLNSFSVTVCVLQDFCAPDLPRHSHLLPLASMSPSVDILLYKALHRTDNPTMAATYGLFYRVYVTIWFQLTAILETITNSFNFLGLYRRRRAKMPDSLEGMNIMITGANSGIGKETAKACAIRGAKVILACRDMEKAKEALTEILEVAGKDKRDNLYLVELDLSSLASVRKCAQQVNNQFTSIDVLINNAGLMMCPQWTTVDGYEVQLATNHLGHFLLTNLLIEKLRAAPAARIVNLSSVAHMPGQMYFDNLNMTGCYTPFKAYARSKLANLMFTRELAKRLKNSHITAYACHPGMVNTELKRHLNSVQRCLLTFLNRMILISPELGAQTSLYCAFDETLKNQSGFYYDNCARVTKLPAHVTDDADSSRLWDISLKLCDIENNNFIN